MPAASPAARAGHEGARARLLAVGFHVPGTGLTRVMRGILEPLADDYEIHHVGIGYRGPTLTGRVAVHPCNLRGGDAYGVYQTADLLERLRPALVLVVNDLWIAAKYPRVLKVTRGDAPLVAYCPVDGRIADETLVEPLTGFDRLVVYTDFARREIEGAASRLRASRAGQLPPTTVIPHGVDGAVFHPLAGSIEAQLGTGGRLAAKRRLFPDLPEPDRSFLVLNANHPQPRKRLDLTIRAFARFAADKPANVLLVLHNAVATDGDRAALLALAGRHGIAGRVRWAPAGPGALADEALNLLYNACDVGLNTAMGEGWGLVAFEHAATGAAQVVPDHSACGELWRGAAEVVECVVRGLPAFSRVEMEVVSVEGVAAALERLYRDEEHRRRMSRAGYRNALRPAYRWERIAERWRGLFEETLASEPAAAPGAAASR